MKRVNLFLGKRRKRKSSDEVHVSAKINANTVINPLKQKGGFKNLKHPIIYLSGILSCLLVLITFTFTSMGCEKPEWINPNDGKNNFSKVVFTTIAQGNLYGGGSEGFIKENIVILTDTAWENLKIAMNSINNEIDVNMKIDFSVYQVIAVFDKIHVNGGRSIDIMDVT
jgi:hypothetical protein